MGIFSTLLGLPNYKDKKDKRFQEIEEKFEGSQEMIVFTKAAWLTSRACHFEEHKELDNAIIDLKEAIELKPDHIPAYIGLGVIYRKQGMFQEALAVLNQAPHKMILLGKETGMLVFDLYNAITWVYLAMNNKSKTIEYAKKAIKAGTSLNRKKEVEIIKEIFPEEGNDEFQIIEMLKKLVQEFEKQQD